MKALMLGATAFIFFAGAASLSWFVWSEPQSTASTKTAKQQKPGTALQASAASADEQIVGVHSRPASAEQLFRMGVLLREQQQGLIRQRERLQEEERRLKLVHQDIDNYKRQLEGMHVELRDKVAKGEMVVEQLRQEREDLEQRRKEAEAAKQQAQNAELDTTSRANISQIARWLQGMDTLAAAKVIQDMANGGQSDFAVQVLSQVEDRTASGILSAIDDEQLVQDLLKKMREMVRTAKRPRR